MSVGHTDKLKYAANYKRFEDRQMWSNKRKPYWYFRRKARKTLQMDLNRFKILVFACHPQVSETSVAFIRLNFLTRDYM